MAVDFKSLGINKQGALISGALAIILTFFGAYIRVSGGGQSENVTNAWDGWGTLASLLLIAAVAIVAAKVFAADVLPREVPWTLVALALSVISALILIIKPFTVDVPSFVDDISVGPGWSGWVLFVALIAFIVFLALLFKDSGEKMPEINRGGTGNTPQAQTPPQTHTPPPAAQTPPPATPPAPPAGQTPPPAAPPQQQPPAPPAG